jgi:hypothetical protein
MPHIASSKRPRQALFEAPAPRQRAVAECSDHPRMLVPLADPATVRPWDRLSITDLSNNADVWEHICSWLSGESLFQISEEPSLRAATLVTPAFIFLSGLNNEGQLVPWVDGENVLSPRFQPLREADDRSGLLMVCHRALHPNNYPLFSYQHCVGGPARPTTPCDCILPLRQRPKMMMMPLKGWVAACLPQPANPSECWESYSAPVFGVRPGFSYPPFWNLLVGDSDSD